MKEKILSADGVSTAIQGTLVSSFVYVVGGVDKLFIAFVLFTVMDVITGVSAAFYRKEVSSRVMYWGTVRKCFLVVLVILAHQLDVITGNTEGFMRNAMLLFIIGTEGISVAENCKKLNLPVPDFIVNSLVRFKGDKASERDLAEMVKADYEKEASYKEVKRNGQGVKETK